MAAYKYNRNKTFKNADSLPAGGYICKIVEVPAYQKWDDSQKKYVKVNDFDSADRTAIPFDIVEGEFTNYYQNKFDSDDSSDKSWKGMMYFKHPSENDKWDTYEKKYNSLGAALEDSNTGFAFEVGNNKSYKGKMLGIVFGEESFKNSNGDDITFAKPKSCYSVDDIRSGNFKIPKPYNSNNNKSASSHSSNDFVDVPEGTEATIPFD